MTFGQQTGPPATARQMQQLLDLVVAAGHSDLRDARGPLGLTQRQAGGRFTRDEADELIGRLEAAAEPAAPTEGPATAGGGTGDSRIDARIARQAAALRSVPSEALAAELQRRGWVVLQP